MLEDLGRSFTRGRLALAAIASLAACTAIVPGAGAAPVSVQRIVVEVHETRAERTAETISTPQLGTTTLDKIGIIKIRPEGEEAKNVLVLEPGTSAAAAYFVPFAKSLVAATPGWQVWAVERRENFLEDQQELTKYKFGELPAELRNENTGEEETPTEQFFNYYLGYNQQDQARATKEAQAQIEAKVAAIVTPQAEAEVHAKVNRIVGEEVEAYVIEQVFPQAYAESAGAEPALAEDIRRDAGEYSATHAEEIAEVEYQDAGRYLAENGEKLEQEGEAIGLELGASYAAEHATELQAEGLELGERIFAELVGRYTNHYEPVPNALVEFAKNWGMARTVKDLELVIHKAKALGGKVVLGGHSLGGSVVTAYATWNFNGHPGAKGLSGLVYDDGGSGPASIASEAEAQARLEALDAPGETPWLAFGGIPAPDLGLFSLTGSALTTVEPKGPSQLEKFSFLPEDLRAPAKDSPATNEAGFGYSVNYKTSPTSLAAAQIHGGEGIEEEAEADGLHGWNGANALTPVGRYAEMLSGTGLREASGSEWYFPARLTLDTGAVNNGVETPSQKVLGLRTTMGRDLKDVAPHRSQLHILAIDTELDTLLGAGGKETTLTEAEALAAQNGIPSSDVTLIDRLDSYSHNDPAGALPEAHEGVEGNVFFRELKPFLERTAHGGAWERDRVER